MEDRKKTRGGLSVGARITLGLLVVTGLAAVTTSIIAVNAVESQGQEAQRISSQALRDQAISYLSQLTTQGAREVDLSLGLVGSAVEQLGATAATLLDSGAGFSLSPDEFWPIDEHMYTAADGQYMNPETDVSSVFVPSTAEITPSVLREIQLTAYLDLVVPGLLANNPTTVAIYFGTPLDVVRYYPNVNLGAVVPHDFAVSGRPWYVASLSDENPERGVLWTDPYLDATGHGLVTTAAMPVFGAQDELLGVIGFDITLNDLRDSIEATRYLETGYPLLIDHSGRAIALPEQGYQDLLGREREADEVAPELAGTTTPFASIITQMAAGEAGTQSVTVDGRELLVAYQPLESARWSLASVVEAQEVLQAVGSLGTQVEAATRSLILLRILPTSAAILAVVIIIGLLLTRRLVRPIRDLVDAAEKLGAGQLDVAVPDKRRDEVGSLARSFNTMAAQIRELVAGLEDRVAERTADIQRRTTQLQTTAEIAKIAGSATDPNEVMAKAIEMIRERFDFYHASMFVLDETGLWAVLAASTGEAGRQLLSRGHRLAAGSASIVGWVAANRKPRVAADVELDPFHFKNPLLPGTRSEAAVPVMIGERLIGVLDVQSTQPNAFGEPDIRAIEAISAELAIAFENARLLQEARRNLEDATPGRRPRWGEPWANILRAEGPTIVHLDPKEGTASDESEVSEVAEEAARTGGPATSADRKDLAVPIVVRGEVVAAIVARRPGTGEMWSDDDIAVVQTIAEQTALALEGARQYTEEQRRLAELELVNRVSQAASQLVNLDSLYRIVHSQLSRVLGGADLTIALYEAATSQVSIPFLSKGGDITKIEATPLGEGLISVVVRSRQPLLLAEDVEAGAAALGAKEVGRLPKSWLGVPMLLGEEILGVMVVQDFESERRFTDDDTALLFTIASQVAAAVENSRLLEQVRRSERRQRLIREITAKVRRAADMDTILTTAARELGKELNANRALARLGAPPAAPPEIRVRTGMLRELDEGNGHASEEERK